jgi:hypothetical protein
VITPLVGIPGISSARTASYRNVFRSLDRVRYYPGGGTVDGTKSRDFANSDNLKLLRPGTLMGRQTSSKEWAPSIVGKVSEAYASGTSLTLTAASAVELNRRVGASGTFKLTGPPTANGTVRQVTVTYSAVNTSTGVVTVTAIQVADVWTLTAADGTDGGSYRLKVTTGFGTSSEASAVTGNLAWDANTATVDAALEALANVGASGVAAVYNAGVLTLTFAATLGDVRVEVVNDTTSDGGVFEGGWVAVHTTTGVDGRFVAGSFVGQADGSETPRTFVPDGTGILIPDDSGDVYFEHIPTEGDVDSSQIIEWPSDTSLRQWIVDSLNAVGYGRFTFDHLMAAG